MDTYGLIGFPLKHSFSVEFFKKKFTAEEIDAEYVNFEMPTIEDFPKIIEQCPNLHGLNVTIPYKEKVIGFLDALSPEAQKIGAVNVICIERNEDGETRLIGHNSDVIGFTNSIRPLLKPCHKRALILGTGGASKAVLRGLEALGLECKFVSREKRDIDLFTYEELTPEIIDDHKVIVNCTPVGMWPKVDFCPDLPYECLSSEHLLYDLTYNPSETLFMKRGKRYGAETKNGLEMLEGQAVAAWEIWNKE